MGGQIRRRELCQGCQHAYGDHDRHSSGTDCSRCYCQGFERFVLPWQIRALVWLDLRTPRLQRWLRRG